MPKLATHTELPDQGSVDREFDNIYRSLANVATGTSSTETILTGTANPAVTPTFVGQRYINTTTAAIYVAGGTAGSYSWGYVGQGATTSFNKNTIPGIIAWYESSNPSNLTLSGSNVTGWTDLSGAGIHMGVDTSSPVYTANVQNGLYGIYFNGTNQALKNITSMTDVAQAYTIILVIKNTNWGTGTYQTIRGAAYTQSFAAFKKNTGNTNMFIECNGAFVSGPSLGNNSYILSGVFNGASSKIYVNGTQTSSGTVNAGNLTDTNAGVLLNAGEWWQGYQFEQLYYSGALSDAQLTTIHTYLNNKWAIY